MALREEALTRAQYWSQHTPNIAYQAQATRRDWAAASLFHLSIEHHSGLICLMDHELESSGFALIRAQWEAYVRGMWIQSIASDQQVETFLKKSHIEPTVREMIEGVQPEDQRALMLELHKTVWRKFNDLAHGGMHQVKARTQSSNIETKFEVEEIAALIDLSIAFCYQALRATATLVRNKNLWDELAEAYGRIYPGQAAASAQKT